ncbi:GCN5 family acetyltransferase [Shewanella mangrovi]|uniref:GCN5 family acetyltransferase n=1 Tax=Shewanella mangrovi TaxID=1515746 RepID=A0A094K1D0_9GAMM|nr:GNAT family N-acetyltransferase [Shewanella mangrovi]KFZ38446.1 GCN5 family acetyltransferase [Shewanella mangrovi]
MELRAFEKADYQLLIRWIKSEELTYLWGGPRYTFPLDEAQITEHCSQPDVFPFVFVAAGQNAGYVELVRISESHFRICRVFISDSFRGQGLSKIMLGQLIALAKARHNANMLSLGVFEQNEVAKACYQSLGFVVTSRETGNKSFAGDVWTLLRMEKRL